MIRAVTLIPGATEFGYEPATVVRKHGSGKSAPENRHVAHAPIRRDRLARRIAGGCVPISSASRIVVAWFGNDLRAGHCTHPARRRQREQEDARRDLAGGRRSTRGDAYLVSQVEGRAAYGGTPSDDSVIHLIERTEGARPEGHALSVRDDGHSGRQRAARSVERRGAAAGLSLARRASPAIRRRAWPARRTAPARPATQVDAFLRGGGERLELSPHDPALRRPRGGGRRRRRVPDRIGAEGLTRVRSASGVYPAVDALVALAADVKAIVGEDTIVTYGADWTEYGSHVVDAGCGRGALSARCAVGVARHRCRRHRLLRAAGGLARRRRSCRPRAGRDDLRPSLSRRQREWRRGLRLVLRRRRGARGADAQLPITDGLGKPWIFRQKDLWNFWSKPHYERVGGAELGVADRVDAAEQADLAHRDRLSRRSTRAPTSRACFPIRNRRAAAFRISPIRRRDDLIQRRYLEARRS